MIIGSVDDGVESGSRSSLQAESGRNWHAKRAGGLSLYNTHIRE